ncbi:hypothetical protein Tco_1103616 [Tanacetum coccineum]
MDDKAAHVNRTDYQLIDISEDGFVSLFTDNGNTKDDLKLPTDDAFFKQNKVSNIEAFASNPSLSWKIDKASKHSLYRGIGVDFKIKQFTVGGKRLELTIGTHVSGQERFRTLTSSEVPKGLFLVKLTCATLHYLLHSERADIRENGSKSPLLLLKKPDLDIPLPMWLMCGLLKSKNNLIRWGFLFVLERVLMCCKFLLDENQLQHSVGNEDHEKTRLDKANVESGTDDKIAASWLFATYLFNPSGFEWQKRDKEDRNHCPPTHHKVSDAPHNRRNKNMKLSKKERAAKLKEMQISSYFEILPEAVTEAWSHDVAVNIILTPWLILEFTVSELQKGGIPSADTGGEERPPECKQSGISKFCSPFNSVVCSNSNRANSDKYETQPLDIIDRVRMNNTLEDPMSTIRSGARSGCGNRYHMEFEDDPALIDLDGVVKLTGPVDPRTVWLSAL